jgi:Ni,Fe-hydrogenase III small subunit/formate hydrogenlyase subunit 6/NADH:ubiquinone oxidoreductase subunit I
MLRALKERLTIQGYRTMSYPDGPVVLPERFRGYPGITAGLTRAEEEACAQSCPWQALQASEGPLTLDMGRCLFCADCPAAAGVSFANDDHCLATASREDLLIRSGEAHRYAQALPPDLKKLFGRSLKFREVSAGGCNACEADSNVLTTIGWDLGRFGIQFVASPRHADGIWVTGPVSNNMREALLKTWEAIPAPKIVVACGACAISGGPFSGSPQISVGLDSLLPVDLYIPGCPPHPATILDGLLRLQGRIP